MAGQQHYDHDAARRAVALATRDVLIRFCSMVLGEAVREAPIEEGTLRGSGTLIEPTPGEIEQAMLTGGRLEVVIAFPLVYAAYQHEGMRADGSYVIENHPKGGKTKYLEDPLKAHAAELAPVIAAAQRKALR